MATVVYSPSKGTVAQGTGTTLSPSVPTNQYNDVIVVPVWERGSTLGTPTVSANSGAISFTSKTSVTITSTERITLFWYRVGATTVTTISVSLTGSNRKAAVAITLRGCITSGDPLTVTSGQNSASSGAQTRTTPNVDTTSVGSNGGYLMGIIGTANQVTGGYAENTTPTNALWVEELAEFNNASASTMAGAVGGGALNGTTSATQPGVAFTFTPSASTASCYITVFFQAQPIAAAPTGFTDNFNRSENPIGSPWVHDPVASRMQANGSILVPLGTQAEEYYPINYSADDIARVRVKIPTNGSFGIGFTDVADNAALNGYFIYATEFSVDFYKLGRGAGGGGDALLGGSTAGIPSGDSIEFVWDMPNDMLSVWWLDSSPATEYLLATQIHTTWDYHQAQYVLLYSDGATSTWDDFATTIGTVTQLGSATITGTSSVSVAATRIQSGSASVSGTSGSSATGITIASGQSTINGASSISASANRIQFSSATIGGSSTAGATGTRIQSSGANISGSSSISASPMAILSGNGVISGLSSISTNAVRIQNGTITIAGISGATTNANLISSAQATINGVSSISANGQKQLFGVVLIDGSGLVNAVPTRVLSSAVAIISGSSVTSADGLRERYGVSTINGSGSVVTNGYLTRFGQITINSSSSIIANGWRILGGISANLDGSGSVNAVGSAVRSGNAIISGSGSVVAQGSGIFVGSTTIDGEGTVSVDGNVGVLFGVATIDGVGDVLAIANVIRNANVSILSTGSVAATAIGVKSGNAVILGSSTAAANASIVKFGNSVIAGSSSASANAISILSGSAIIDGNSLIEINGTKILLGQSTIDALGSSVILAGKITEGFAEISGQSSVDAIGNTILDGYSLSSGESSISIDPIAILDGSATISGDTDLLIIVHDQVIPADWLSLEIGGGQKRVINDKHRVFPSTNRFVVNVIDGTKSKNLILTQTDEIIVK